MESTAPAPEELSAWIGRTMQMEDLILPKSVAALDATLDHEVRLPQNGEPIPPGHHWIFFNGAERQSQLGPDGHPRRGGFLPPVPLPRRMWAGGLLRFHAPLRVGRWVTRRSKIASVEQKAGRTGLLAFVTVHHEIVGGPTVLMEEDHDIVYREMPAADAAPSAAAALAGGEPAPADAIWSRRIDADPVLLFRYSALTFNGHRIHYDPVYTTEVERYPGLIVHGPLIATLLLDLIRRELPAARVAGFRFRARSTLFVPHPFTVNGRPAAGGSGAVLWAADHAGRLAMDAEAAFA